jgi:hypothetical protein
MTQGWLLLQTQLEMQLIERLKLKQQQQVQAARQLEEAVAMRQSARWVVMGTESVLTAAFYERQGYSASVLPGSQQQCQHS